MRNIVLIFAGVAFLLWLSNFDNNAITENLQVYSTGLGRAVTLLVSLFISLSFYNSLCKYHDTKSTEEKPQNLLHHPVLRITLIHIALYVALMSITPTFTSWISDSGDSLANFIIKANG